MNRSSSSCAATQVAALPHRPRSPRWRSRRSWNRSASRGCLDVLLPDVNILVYAHRVESPDHDRYAEWLRALAGGMEPFGLSELGASAFVRIVTNPKLWDDPTTLDDALLFVERLRTRSNARLLTHGAGLCETLHPCARSRQTSSGCLPCSAGDRTWL